VVPNVEPDAEVLARIARGDTDALGALYDRYAPTLFPIALRILRVRAEAEDALHDAFVVVSERAAQYTPDRGTVSAWLVTLVRNLCIDRARRRERRGALLQREAAEPPESTRSPESQADAKTNRARIRAALDALPEAQRDTLLVAFFEGLSYPEIAERDGVPLGTVKSRAARAMAALRDLLEEGKKKT
jgi:RNA polymerase sigma-70 factor (ECF subfamily)